MNARSCSTISCRAFCTNALHTTRTRLGIRNFWSLNVFLFCSPDRSSAKREKVDNSKPDEEQVVNMSHDEVSALWIESKHTTSIFSSWRNARFSRNLVAARRRRRHNRRRDYRARPVQTTRMLSASYRNDWRRWRMQWIGAHKNTFFF